MLLHKESLTGTMIKLNWDKEIGDWFDPLYSLLESDYVDDLVSFINEKYKENKFVYPKRSRLFKAFESCKYSELKVVMISSSPAMTERSSGIGFGIITNNEEDPLPAALENLKIVIKENLYKNSENVYFDTSLQEVAEQGVLFLNTSMTREVNDNHHVIWRNFIRQVIKTISKGNKDIVFVFLDGENERFEKYIDIKKHYILRNAGTVLPSYSQIINKVENIILDKYGSREYIQW